MIRSSVSREQNYNQIGTLQNKLGEAKRRGDTRLEIDTLLEIGRVAASAGDLGLANMHFDLASRVIRDSGTALERLQEALGERALILRRMKRYQESLDLYKRAATAAHEYAGTLEYAHWVSKQGVIHRLMDKTDLARDAFERARDLFNELGEAGIAGVADQEGNLGLLYSDIGDNKAAEEAYRCAVELAISAGSNDLIATWATNLGNALSRRRRYHKAWNFYEKAMAASLQLGDDHQVEDTAVQWSVSYQRAHRRLQAAETLINATRHLWRPALKCQLLEDSMLDLHAAGAWQRLVEIGSEVARILEEHDTDPDRLERCNTLINIARENIARKPGAIQSTPGQPTTLDIFISSRMAEYTESNNVEGMRDVAHLICDVNLGLMNPTEEAWKPLLSKTYLRYRVVGEAMRALCEAGMPEQSLELSQRFKSLGFCLPSIQRMHETGAPNEDAASYLASLETLSQAVAALKGPVTEDGPQRVDAVRAAGEMLLEAGEELRDRDRILHARLGGVIPTQDLIDALPTSDPVAIVDFFVTRDGTIIHILVRRGNTVQVIPAFATAFTAEHALYLLKVWSECNIAHEISGRQREGLIEIGSMLHGRLFCALARQLSELWVSQIILIPDAITRHLPLHLSGVCSKDLGQIIEKINIPDISVDEVSVFGEVFPVEYAPCVQTVAVSQHQKRPRAVSGVLSLADPISDLPGARNISKWLASRLPETLEYTSYVGEEATLANLFSGIDRANIAVIGTHGSFNSANPQESFLEFHDGRWTMSNMLDRLAFNTSPVIVLSACEVGAIAPTVDELAASGIPGALISTGAACVLASLWPVEDISMGYIIERFLTHLSHPGYRPAAALFRALRDVRRLNKQEALERCYNLREQMESDGTADRLPEPYLMLNNLIEWIEDSDLPCPFASPLVWGGIVIVGSGWYRQAGAEIGSLDELENIVNRHSKGQMARSRMAEGKFNEAREILEEILPYTDGEERARTLEALAWVVWESRDRGNEQVSKRKAKELLAQAEFLAKAEQNDPILRNINATRQKIELYS